MKIKFKSVTIIFFTLIFIYIVYRSIFSDTIFRFSNNRINENINGIKYTTVCLINPFKKEVIYNNISNWLVDINNINLDDERKYYILSNLDIHEFEILDISEKKGIKYIFTKFNFKEGYRKDLQINRILFIENKKTNNIKIIF